MGERRGLAETLPQMRRELLADLAQAHRTELARVRAEMTKGWVRDERWTHPPSDDFPGCTE